MNNGRLRGKAGERGAGGAYLRQEGMWVVTGSEE